MWKYITVASLKASTVKGHAFGSLRHALKSATLAGHNHRLNCAIIKKKLLLMYSMQKRRKVCSYAVIDEEFAAEQGAESMSKHGTTTIQHAAIRAHSDKAACCTKGDIKDH